MTRLRDNNQKISSTNAARSVPHRRSTTVHSHPKPSQAVSATSIPLRAVAQDHRDESQNTVRAVTLPDSTHPHQPAASAIPPKTIIAMLGFALLVVLGLVAVSLVYNTQDTALAETSEALTVIESDPSTTWNQGTVPHIYQRDPQWSSIPYSTSTLGDMGSMPACLVMAYVQQTGDRSITLPALSAWADQQGLASQSTEDYEQFLDAGADNLGLSVKALAVNELSLRKALLQNHPVIAITLGATTEPWAPALIIGGITEEGTLRIVDPVSPERSQKAWTFEELLGQCQSLWEIQQA